MLLCQHEKIAVQIAHGYAKASGKPLAVIVHNVVGLLHSVMGIYYAYIDRAPIFIIGATGPMDEGKRRPWIDWIHTANVQGEQVRNYVKWDYQPGSIDGVVDSFARAYSVMMTEPQGPIYMCYDACAAGGAARRAGRRCPTPARRKAPSRIAPDPAALEEAAERILAADWPVLMPEFVGRVAYGFCRHGRARRDARRAGRRRRHAAEFPDRASARSPPDAGGLPARRPDRRARPPQLGAADALQRPHQPDEEVLLSRRAASGSTSASPTSRSANGRWTTRNSRTARTACWPTRRSPSRRSPSSAARASPAIQALAEKIEATPCRRGGIARRAAGRMARRRRRRAGTLRRSRCRGSPRRSGTRSETRTGC